MNAEIDSLLKHTRDEKFITSRQCLQNIWKIALVNPVLKEKVVTHLEEQYITCKEDKHYNLIREDIIQSLKNIYDGYKDPSLLETIKKLIQSETDLKYRKKLELIVNN
jgi:hypothetical protein